MSAANAMPDAIAPTAHFEPLFPAFAYVCVPLHGAAFGTDHAPDTLFRASRTRAGSRVYFQRPPARR